MSTRATYLFKAPNEWRPDVCIYIHHDGYEAGAAYYFYRAWQSARAPSYIGPEDMIRGNDRAEITGGHETHDDTAYRYTMNGDHLTVDKGCGDTWKPVFNGLWFEFVNRNITPDWVPDFQPLRLIKLDYGVAVYSPESLQALIHSECRTLGLWATNGNDRGVNWDNLTKRIKTAREQLAQFGGPRWAEEG